MTDDYYSTDHRPGVDEQLAQSGWRRKIGQRLRFEAALAPWDWAQIDSVLDLGCGSAGLARYMAETGRSARYVGVERRSSAVDYARSHLPAEAEIRVGDLYDEAVVDESFDLVVAIGAQVDGTAPNDAADRVARVHRLVDRCHALATRGAAVIVLDQSALDERPGLGLEPALFGVTPEELAEILAPVDRASTVSRAYLSTDLAAYVADDGGVFRTVAVADDAALHERVVEHHLEQGGAREDVAWLWIEAGRPDRARQVLDELVESNGETAEIRHLYERLGHAVRPETDG